MRKWLYVKYNAIIARAEKLQARKNAPKYCGHMFIIAEDSKWKMWWDLYCMSLVIYVALVVPYRLGFGLDDTPGMVKFGRLMDISFLIDVILTFFQEFTDESTHRKVLTHRGIAINYIKGWFLLDTLSIFPFEAVLSKDSNIGNAN